VKSLPLSGSSGVWSWNEVAVDGIAEGDEVEIELTIGEIRDVTTKKNYRSASFPPFMQQIIKAGGLIEYVRRKLNG